MFSITPAELNYLVFNHLRESGFTHAAFALEYEAGINKTIIEGNLVPPGALITFVQKGIQYLQLEANLNCSDADTDGDFSFLQPLDLVTKDVYELQKMIQNLRKAIDGEKKKEKNETEQEHERELASEREVAVTRRHEENGIVGGPEPMETETCSTLLPCQISSSDVMVLEGHTSEVIVCAWSRAGSLLATGSGDSTARIWSIKEGPCTSILENGLLDVAVLKHYKGITNYKRKDVTALDWNGDGTLLATGSYDGKTRVWNRNGNGELNLTLTKHMGPIFSLKWNKKGDYLVSGSVDKTAIVWDMNARGWKQQFEFHSGRILDVDWRNNVSFATCSADNMIYVCKVGENRPIKSFSGHQGEVNAIKWDATGSLLASCSDDSTAKIWSMKHDTCLHDFKEHSKAVYTIEWSPTGPGTNNPNHQSILASASYDSTIKLWDVGSGSLLHSLNGHRDPVFAVAFSPNGEYLASGSQDRSLHIWSVKEAKIVKTYPGSSGIFSVCWNNEGDKIGACFVNNLVCVLDFRM